MVISRDFASGRALWIFLFLIGIFQFYPQKWFVVVLFVSSLLWSCRVAVQPLVFKFLILLWGLGIVLLMQSWDLQTSIITEAGILLLLLTCLWWSLGSANCLRDPSYLYPQVVDLMIGSALLVSAIALNIPTFGSGNQIGFFFGAIFLIAILVRRWWVCVLCLPWMFIGNNTSSFIALSIVIVVLGYRSLRLESRAGLYSCAGLLLISALAFLPDRLSESTNQVFDFFAFIQRRISDETAGFGTTSFEWRLITWGMAIEQLINHQKLIWGWFPGAAKGGMVFDVIVRDLHNDYLSIISDIGLMGFAFVLLCLATAKPKRRIKWYLMIYLGISMIGSNIIYSPACWFVIIIFLLEPGYDRNRDAMQK